MKDRIRNVRKSLKLTQEEFASSLGLTRHFINQVENGNRVFSDRTLKDICERYNVDPEWLRSGVGEMFNPRSRFDEIAAFVGGLNKLPDSDFKKRFFFALSQLPESDWEVLADLAEKLKD